jgi:hypothetical protein
MTIWRMRVTFWIPKATNIHSQYVIFIALLLQQSYTNAPQCYATRLVVTQYGPNFSADPQYQVYSQFDMQFRY